jgi:N-acetylneuraminate synthase
VLDVETELYEKARRAIHAVEPIKPGEEFTDNNVSVLRPGKQEAGLRPKHYGDIIGKTAASQIPDGHGIQWEDIADQ